MKNNSGFSTPMLVAIILFLSAIIFLYLQYSSKNTRTVPVLNNGATLDDKTIVSKGELTTEELPNGNIKITSNLNNIEFIVPATYNLFGSESNFSVSFYGIDSEKGPGPRDFSQLQFRHGPLEGDLYEEVKEQYRSSQENEEKPVNYDDVKNINFGDANGYYYACPFLVHQECIFLPLKNDPNNYLFILKNFSDDNNLGYEDELNRILSSLQYLNQPTRKTNAVTYTVYENIETGCFNVCSGDTKLIGCKEQFGVKECEYSCFGKLTNSCDK